VVVGVTFQESDSGQSPSTNFIQNTRGGTLEYSPNNSSLVNEGYSAVRWAANAQRVMFLVVVVVVELVACGGDVGGGADGVDVGGRERVISWFLLMWAHISALRSFSVMRSHSAGRSSHGECAVTCGDARKSHEIIAAMEQESTCIGPLERSAH